MCWVTLTFIVGKRIPFFDNIKVGHSISRFDELRFFGTFYCMGSSVSFCHFESKYHNKEHLKGKESGKYLQRVTIFH